MSKPHYKLKAARCILPTKHLTQDRLHLVVTGTKEDLLKISNFHFPESMYYIAYPRRAALRAFHKHRFQIINP